MQHTIVVVGGSQPSAGALARTPPATCVITADSGYDHARSLGLAVDVLVGDLDSISEAGLADARRTGVHVERHDPDKDATDTELALRLAVAGGATHVTLLAGAPGDRLDHSLAVLVSLVHPNLAGVVVDAWIGTAAVHAFQGACTRSFGARVGETLTLLAVGGDATGITTRGLRYPLVGEPLSPTSSRGVSNVAAAPDPSVTVQAGRLLVIRPEALP